jgi:hypothetical protein
LLKMLAPDDAAMVHHAAEVGRTLQHAPNIDKPRLRGVTLSQAHPKSGSVGQGGRSRTERGRCGRSIAAA